MSGDAGADDVSVVSRLERQLEAAEQITHIGSWQWNVATGAVSWSDELYRIYGFAPRSHEVTLAWFLERLHPEDRAKIQDEIRAALAARGRFHYRERIVRPDGTVRELDTIGQVRCDEAGQPIGVLGTCRDVTEELRRDETIKLYADVVAKVQIGLSVWRLDDPADPGSLRLIAYNAATEAAIGVTLGEHVGKPLRTIFPSALASQLPALMAAVGPATPVRELAAFRFGAAPHAPILAVKAFAMPDRGVGLALEDITKRVRAEALEAGERRVLEMLAGGAAIGDVLAALVRLIEDLAPETLASILLLDRAGERLVHGAAPELPGEFNRAIDGAPIGARAGSCGTAAFRKEPVFVADIDTDPLWDDYRELARAHGLRACWSTPILASDGRVLGTFAVYYREPRLPDEASKELIARAAHVAGIVIQRRQLDDELSALTARIEAIREDERTGIAREIHDELGQALTALKLDVAWLARRSPGNDVVKGKLEQMSRGVDEILLAVRRISAELRPGLLDDLGLLAAIEWQAEEFTRRTGTRCEVRSDLGDVRFDRGLATAVFRIFQEALTNVARHAGATLVLVTLGLERGQLRLDVADDGTGIPDTAIRGSLGLLGMRERARRLAGECTITRRVPHGTIVSLRVPLRFPAEQHDAAL